MRDFVKLVAVVLGIFVIQHFLGQKNSGRGGVIILPLDVKYVVGDPVNPGKPALVEFWATWCPPCRSTIPHLNALHDKWKSKLQMVGITNEGEDAVKNFINELPMNYSVACDESGKYSRSLGVRGIPHAFLIDESGAIRWDGNPSSLTDTEISRILMH